MQDELNELEDRIERTVSLCRRLGIENLALKDQMIVLQTENQKLVDKLSTVVDRLETMLQAFPQPEADTDDRNEGTGR